VTSDLLSRLTGALADCYRIESRLGEGGMATVYLAEDLKHKRKVAVKVLRPELAAVLGAERFVQEITTTASLQHPHILPLFDSGEADSFLYYVMPFIDGETLRDKLNRDTQLSIDEAVGITTDIADALDYAHRHNVIHRDIKPENILIHDGRPMVADFGIALAVSAAAGGRMTETGLSLGTPHYMSPEQATAEKNITNRSDVYSLGAMLYEMLTGDPPHTGGNAQQIISKIVTEEPAPVTKARKTVPPNVAAATAKALEKLPADRFESAVEFAGALTDLTYRGNVGATASQTAGGNPLVSRVLAMVTAIAVVAALWGWMRPTGLTSRPMIMTETLIPMEVASTNYGSNFDLSPDGALLVYMAGFEGTPRLWLLDRRTLDLTLIPRTEDANTPFFSPDGLQVGFVTNQFVLKTVSLRGEAQAVLVDGAVQRAGADWGHDGYIYFGAGPSALALTGLRGLARVPETGGPIEPITEVDTAAGDFGHFLPHLLANGRGVLFVISRGRLYDANDMDIAVADLSSGSYHELGLKGIVARDIGHGFIVIVTADGSLMGVPFDDERLKVTGPSVSLAEGVGVERNGIADFAVNSSGTMIFGTRTPELGDLVWVDRNGFTEPIDSNWVENFTSAFVSPDGITLAVSFYKDGDEQIWLRDLPSGQIRQLSSYPRSVARVRGWTPDGRGVVFWKNYALSVLPVDGGGADVELVERGWPGDISFSPDEAWVVYASSAGGQLDVYLAKRGEPEATRVLVSESAEHSARVSPNGRWLAFVSDESGADEVYVRPFTTDTGTVKWPVSTGGGQNPVWAHNGGELFYRSGSELIVTEILPGAAFRRGDQRVLFTQRERFASGYYDVSPDGQRFLMRRWLGGEEAVTERVVIVDNAIDELRKAAGN